MYLDTWNVVSGSASDTGGLGGLGISLGDASDIMQLVSRRQSEIKKKPRPSQEYIIEKFSKPMGIKPKRNRVISMDEDIQVGLGTVSDERFDVSMDDFDFDNDSELKSNIMDNKSSEEDNTADEKNSLASTDEDLSIESFEIYNSLFKNQQENKVNTQEVVTSMNSYKGDTGSYDPLDELDEYDEEDEYTDPLDELDDEWDEPEEYWDDEEDYSTDSIKDTSNTSNQVKVSQPIIANTLVNTSQPTYDPLDELDNEDEEYSEYSDPLDELDFDEDNEDFDDSYDPLDELDFDEDDEGEPESTPTQSKVETPTVDYNKEEKVIQHVKVEPVAKEVDTDLSSNITHVEKEITEFNAPISDRERELQERLAKARQKAEEERLRLLEAEVLKAEAEAAELASQNKAKAVQNQKQITKSSNEKEDDLDKLINTQKNKPSKVIKRKDVISDVDFAPRQPSKIDMYSAMKDTELYYEVRKFLKGKEIQRKPVNIKELNEEFGAANIKKLITKSYLISTGKGVTIGR